MGRRKPGALFCQTSNLLNPGHWRMVWDIIRFNQQSVDYLRQVKAKPVEGAEISIGEWLDARGYSRSFRKNYLIPMTASIWSTAPETALNSFPAVTLLRFMHNHHLLQILDRPQWLTIKNGSHSYVDRILSKLPRERIHQGNEKGEVTAAWFDPKTSKWTLRTGDGKEHAGWDKVIFASHADTTTAILKAGAARQKFSTELQEVVDVLARFKFSENSAVLHADTRLMPVRRSAWSAWNFLAETVPSSATEGSKAGANGKQVTPTTKPDSSTDVDRVSLTYWMNLLQSIPESKFGPVLVTLNPTSDPSSPFTPRPELVLKRQSYTHPLYTPDSVLAQRQLRALQGTQNAYFAGAWTNYGFHEDGFSSGLRAAEQIEGVYLPFDVRHAEREIPAAKTMGCRIAESVDGVAKWSVVSWPVEVVFVVVMHVLAVVEVLLVLTGLGGKEVGEGVGRVKGYFRESVRREEKKRVKAA